LLVSSLKSLYINAFTILGVPKTGTIFKMATSHVGELSNGAITTSNMAEKHFHIFGLGVSFSMSPTIHTAAFRHHGLPHTYDIRETQSIDESGHLISDALFGGASVTMPHKLAVYKFCDEQSIHARRIGAINTLVVDHRTGTRRIIGDNTDWSGLYGLINLYMASSTGSHAVGLMVGAGGASRAALYAMYQAGIKRIFLINRTIANTERIARDLQNVFHVQVVADLKSLPEDPDVVIGTIPAEKTQEQSFSELFSKDNGLCIDMSYKPRNTPLLMAAKRHKGWKTVPGVEVLLYQAFDQYRLWTGRSAPEKVMLQAVAEHDRTLVALSHDARL
jgi:shikimate-5-dehydrogenase